MNMVQNSRVYADARLETVFTDRPFGFGYVSEITQSWVWTHLATFGM